MSESPDPFEKCVRLEHLRSIVRKLRQIRGLALVHFAVISDDGISKAGLINKIANKHTFKCKQKSSESLMGRRFRGSGFFRISPFQKGLMYFDEVERPLL